MVDVLKTIAVCADKLEKPPILISKLAGSLKLNKLYSPLKVIKDRHIDVETHN